MRAHLEGVEDESKVTGEDAISFSRASYEDEESKILADVYAELNRKGDTKVDVVDFTINTNSRFNMESALTLPNRIVGDYPTGSHSLHLNVNKFTGITMSGVTEFSEEANPINIYKTMVDVTSIQIMAFSIVKLVSRKLKSSDEKCIIYIMPGVQDVLGEELAESLKVLVSYILSERGFVGACFLHGDGVAIKIYNKIQISELSDFNKSGKKVIQEIIDMDFSTIEYEKLHEATVFNINRLCYSKAVKEAYSSAVDNYIKWDSESNPKYAALTYLYSLNALAIPSLTDSSSIFKDNCFSKDLLLNLGTKVDELYKNDVIEDINTVVWPAVSNILGRHKDPDYDYGDFEDCVKDIYLVCKKLFREDYSTYVCFKGITNATIIDMLVRSIHIPSKKKTKLEDNFEPAGHLASDEVAATTEASGNFSENKDSRNYTNDLEKIRKLKSNKFKNVDDKYNVSHKSKKAAKATFHGTAFVGEKFFKGLFSSFKYAKKQKKETKYALGIIIIIAIAYFVYMRF